MNQMVQNQTDLYWEVFPHQDYKFHWLIFQKIFRIHVAVIVHVLNVIFFMNWYYICFFAGAWVDEIIQRLFWNIIDSDLSKDSSHILIILMEILWPSWALFSFKLLIILMTKSRKGTELIFEFVKYTWFSGSLLLLARGVPCLPKNH